MELKYHLVNGQSINLINDLNKIIVFCENRDGTIHWHKEFTKEKDAIKEFEKWAE